MPQTWETYWPLSDGALAPADVSQSDDVTRSAVQARHAIVHTLPNLTLLTPPGNSSAGNLGFEAKKTRLKDSLLKTNIAIAAEPQWDEEAMARRADRIIQAAAKLWPSPMAAEEPHGQAD